ncbi:hypothetical protein [Pseudomonas fluorescens]|uniref:hypothetical protein n=1 Tax=Pseudomonas fluorescens TaxID=294 RepID=UPI001241B0A2|nr:hypothetical protein [Pseudomonas fluorescens]
MFDLVLIEGDLFTIPDLFSAVPRRLNPQTEVGPRGLTSNSGEHKNGGNTQCFILSKGGWPDALKLPEDFPGLLC